MRLSKHLLDEGFSIDAARELCRIPGMFEAGAVYKRNVITSKLRSAFIEAGGNQNTSKEKVIGVFKSWARRDSPFESVDAFARYRFLGYGEQSSQPGTTSADEVQGNDAPEDNTPSPEKEFGNGPYEVYAWCLPHYQNGHDSRWPIKIGMAGIDGLPRRFQDFWQNLPERPHYLIRLGCAEESEARERERLLHHYFKSRGQKIEDLPGNEWFLTNTDELVEAVQFIAPRPITG